MVTGTFLNVKNHHSTLMVTPLETLSMCHFEKHLENTKYNSPDTYYLAFLLKCFMYIVQSYYEFPLKC